MTMKTREIPTMFRQFFPGTMSFGKLRPKRAEFGAIASGMIAVLTVLSGCAVSYPPDDAVSHVPVRLVTPSGGLFGPSGDVAAKTVQDFGVFSGKGFVVAKGSLLRGAYKFTRQDSSGSAQDTWVLTVDWQSLKGHGASRIPDGGRRPPLITIHEIESETDLPDIAKGVEIPVMYFNLETGKEGGNRLVPLDTPPRLNEAPEDRREAGPD